LELVRRRRHGGLSSFFGSVLVVIAIASIVVWVFGLCDALANRDLIHDGLSQLLIAAWLTTSLLLGLVGAIASREDSVLACSHCSAVTPALSIEEAEESSLAGSRAAPAGVPGE
jgi:hypothetical protein